MSPNAGHREALLGLADELSSEIARAATLMRQPLLHRDVSVQRVRVMSHLLRSGPLRVTQLAIAEDVTQPTMTAMVAGLTASGLVTRQNDDSDGRARIVMLTPKGEEIVRSYRRSRAEFLASRLAQLNDDQVRLLEALAPTLTMLIELLDRTTDTEVPDVRTLSTALIRENDSPRRPRKKISSKPD
jgi:DNA-binding MarR family transcriptional regulator